jgi:hypothetical protein
MEGQGVDAGGVLDLGYTIFTRDAEFHGSYSGTLTATGGTLTGTQVWTRATSGESVTRTCTAPFWKLDRGNSNVAKPLPAQLIGCNQEVARWSLR